jgi:hypothetical protein
MSYRPFKSLADAARDLGRDLEAVNALIAEGRLEAVQFGSITFVRASDVDELAAGGGVSV